MQSVLDCIFQLVENALEAKATIIKIGVFQRDAKRLVLIVEDNGNGMSEENCKLSQSPFFSTKDKEVGMGIPMVKEMALRTGGDFAVESNSSGGVTVSALFKPYNINMIPIGDLYKGIKWLIKAYPNIDFVLTQKTGNKNITIDTRFSKPQV